MTARGKPVIKLDELIASGRVDASLGKTGLGQKMDAATRVNMKRSGTFASEPDAGPASAATAVPAAAAEPAIGHAAPDAAAAASGAASNARNERATRELRTELPLSLIDDSPHQRHRHIDERYVEQLAESMRDVGQAEPIKVRPSPATPGRFETIAGHHRRRAMALLGQATIMAVVEAQSELEAKKGFLVTNEARKDLSDWERAKQYFDALHVEPTLAKTQRELARLLAKGEDQVSRCLAMLKLPASMQRLLEANPKVLSSRVATEALKLLRDHPSGSDEVVAEAQAMYEAFGTDRYRGDEQAFRTAVLLRMARRGNVRLTLASKSVFTGATGHPVLTSQVRKREIVISLPEGLDPEDLHRRLHEPLRQLALEIERQTDVSDGRSKPAMG